jgi:rSAM/selenodomain-associated transferase 1
MENTLIIFVKAPVAGRVKTRLQPDLSAEEAAGLASAFVADMLWKTHGLENTVRIIGCDPAREDPYFRTFGHGTDFRLIDQRGSNLGERMRNAFQDAAAGGADRMVIIGTDLPTLPLETVQKAFSLLRRNDLVLGPSLDGGYYLIGSGREVPEVFGGIPWGTDRVLERTLDRANDLKIRCALLPFWYDVDTPRDLRFLSAHLRYLESLGTGDVAPETSRFLRMIMPKIVRG